LAVANYHSAWGSLPPAYVVGPDGKPWHSWRVLILPYLEQAEAYNRYNFDEPWDGPNNAKLAGSIPMTYLAPDVQQTGTRKTSYVAVVGPETAWPGAGSLRMEDIPDGTGHTILLIEVADSGIHWMEPRDYRFDAMSFRVNDRSGRGPGSRIGGARMATVDGAVRHMPDDFDPQTLRAVSMARGGESISDEAGKLRVIFGPNDPGAGRRQGADSPR
jgi:hypothetical protein